MIEACIFDLDGVIVDTAKYHYKAWKRLADCLNIPFDESENEKMKGISRMASLEKLISLGNKSYTDGEKRKFCHTKNLWYLSYVGGMDEKEVLPGLMDFLQELKSRNIKIALGSASKNARHILNMTKLTNEFHAIVDGNDVTKSKPDPEVFTKGATLLKASPSATIVFEDSAKGIDAAISGGFKTVGIGSMEHLSHAGLVINSFNGLTVDLLNEHFYSY